MIYDQVLITYDQLVSSHDQSILSYDQFVTPYDQLVPNYDQFATPYDQLVIMFEQSTTSSHLHTTSLRLRPVYDFDELNDLLVYSPFASRHLVELQVR